MTEFNKSRTLSETSLQKAFRNTVLIIVLLLMAILIANFVSGCKIANQDQTKTLENTEISESSDFTYHDQDGSLLYSNPDAKSTSSGQESSKGSETAIENETSGEQKPTAAPTVQPTPQTTPTTEATTIEDNSATVKVTIPEGFSLIQICQRLDAAGVNSFEKLFDCATTDDFSEYSAISEAGFPANRCFQLEGYLFPDTYVFYRDENPKSVWGRFLHNFSVKTESYTGMTDKFGWSMDQAVIFASLLEREAGNDNEVAKVSSVMHNRLDSGMMLQLDASIVYVENYIKPYISGDINRFNAYYNTYKTAALPAGPICNPGLRALSAALNPADTDYYYFANDNAEPPNYYYSATLAEHQAILEQYNIGQN